MSTTQKAIQKGIFYHEGRISTKEVQAVVGHDAVELTERTYYHGEKHADLSSYPEL